MILLFKGIMFLSDFLSSLALLIKICESMSFMILASSTLIAFPFSMIVWHLKAFENH